MTNIGILTLQDGFSRGACDFYPLIKWAKEFKIEGYIFRYFKNHNNKKLLDNDIVFIDHRYYRQLVVIKKKFPDKKFIIELILKLKENGIKVVLFDNADGSGGREWDLIEYVDILVKKQILKNREYYTLNKGVESYLPFVSKYDISKDRKEKNIKYKYEYKPCQINQLSKLKLGWNIGMLDYRYFPFQRYYPIGTSRLINSLYKTPFFEKNFSEKSIDSTFRGKINKVNENYSFQRNKVIGLFKSKRYTNFITGEFISKKKYLEELRRSKTCVSPYGWGEICYRDFEAIIAGALLIKPDMGHVETFPNIYIKDKTYVHLKWDMSDLEEILVSVIENIEEYKSYVIDAQEIYKNAITDHSEFIRRFKEIIN